MSKFSPEIAASICDFLCGHSIVIDACRAHGISNTTFWDWIAKSKQDELPEIVWLDMQAPFWKHIQNAKQIFANHLLDSMTERARYGSERRIVYQGREMFAVDPSIPPDLDSDPDLMELLYGVRDRFLRDATGKMIHLTERVEPPVQLQLAVAAASFAAYQPHSSQSIEVTQRGDIGVRHVGGPPKAEPLQVEHKVVEAKISNDLPHAQLSPEAAKPLHELPIEPDFTQGAEMAVEPPPADKPVEWPSSKPPTPTTPADDRVAGSKFYIPPPPGSSKIPEGRVEVFTAEASSDPVEALGAEAAPDAPRADPPPATPAPRPDVYQHVSVRAAALKVQKHERPQGAIEAQLMNALTNPRITPEQRTRRLQELVGDYRDAEDRSEGLGAGIAEKQKGVRMI